MNRATAAVLAIAALVSIPTTASADVGVDGDRTLELVTTTFKNGNPVSVGRIAADGRRALTYGMGGTPGSSSGTNSYQLIERGADRWEPRDVTIDRRVVPAAFQIIGGATPDFTGLVFFGSRQAAVSSTSWLMRLTSLDDVETLQTFSQHTLISDVTVSDDLGVVVGQVTGSSGAGLFNPGALYDYGSGIPRQVSILPGGEPSLCVADTSRLLSQHAMSSDGRRVAFTMSPAPDCADPRGIFQREAGTARDFSGPDAQTVRIDEPPVGEADMGAEFVQATEDGSEVFVKSATGLIAADTDGEADVYRYNAASGARDCLTCNDMAPARVSTATASEDGSRVYFTSPNQLVAGEGAPGVENLYVWTAKDGIRYVSASDGVSRGIFAQVDMSPDGKTLVFGATSQVTGVVPNGTHQLYRYDDRRREISCISCPPGGLPSSSAALPTATGFWQADHVRSLSDDGDTVFFDTSQALVATDVNNDADVYEWHNGRIGLISDGTTIGGDWPSSLLGTSASGDDVLFVQWAASTPDAGDSVGQVYNAHRGPGGFVARPPGDGPCGALDCRPHGPLAPPALREPGSDGFDGLGTSVAARAQRPSIGSVVALSAAARSALASGRRARLRLRVSRAGRVTVTGTARVGGRSRRVVAAAARARAAGRVGVSLRLSRPARREIARRGSLRVRLTVRFDDARPRVLSVELTRPRSRPSKRGGAR